MTSGDWVAILGTIGGIVVGLGALAGGIATWRGSKGTGTKTAVETMQIIVGELRTELNDAKRQLTDAQTRIGTLEAQAQAARQHAMGQDDALYRLGIERTRAVDHALALWAWIDSGAQPPPPSRPLWLSPSVIVNAGSSDRKE